MTASVPPAPEAQATFTRELDKIRRALPSYSEVLHVERVERAELQLMAAPRQRSAEHLDRSAGR